MGNQTTTNGAEDSPDDHVYMMLRTVQPKMELVLNFYLVLTFDTPCLNLFLLWYMVFHILLLLGELYIYIFAQLVY